MNYLQEVGKRIADRRKQLGITQDALATAVGYTSRSSINKIEKGLVNLPQSKVSEIASVLLVDPAYIMGWETETKPKIKFNMRLFDGRAEEETEKKLPPEPKLSEEEKEMLDIFRLIPDDMQRVFLEMGRAYANSLKKE